MPRATGLALALLCVLCGSGAAPARAAPVRLPCEAATRVAGCSECIPSAKKCFACIEGRYPQWATEGHTKQVRARRRRAVWGLPKPQRGLRRQPALQLLQLVWAPDGAHPP